MKLGLKWIFSVLNFLYSSLFFYLHEPKPVNIKTWNSFLKWTLISLYIWLDVPLVNIIDVWSLSYCFGLYIFRTDLIIDSYHIILLYFIYTRPSIDYLVEFTGHERLTSGGNGTAGIWSTYPPDHVSNWTGFADQVYK